MESLSNDSLLTNRKNNGAIDSIQVRDVEETICTLQSIGVTAKKSKEYDDEVDIDSINDKTLFVAWMKSEHYKLSNYPRLKRFLK